MSEPGRHGIRQDSRHSCGDARPPARCREAVKRCLGAAGYRGWRREHLEAAGSTIPARALQAGAVVVGVDDSPCSRAAVDHAAIEAELRRWDLRLLHVQPAGAALFPAPDRGARLLERMAERVHAQVPTVAVFSHLAVGAAATALLAELSDTDMVVVGHRRGSAHTAFGLSIAERVAARHSGPALVVQVPGRPPGREFTDRPIVVGVDDPWIPTPALAFARAEAKLRTCELIVLHRMGDPAPQSDQAGVRVLHRAVADDPIKALTAASDRAAAVVVGRSDGTGVTTEFVGSVGRALIRDAACSVFLIG